MRKNEVVSLTADAVGADMEGVARHEGMAVFVPGLLPGETAQVRIVKVQSRYAFGRVEGAMALGQRSAGIMLWLRGAKKPITGASAVPPMGRAVLLR